ncbi:MAG: type II toxin-antitoxin system mRNA interferase toxin, RelE/StbE family [Phascolarctobacterium sp.]|nr:MAG: type II toxin-antitoxin system mRNA interferase toxin, RelE/StbE family [Phascolarctobacterium sp.]
MLDIQYEATFKRDFKRILKRGLKPQLLEEVITLLAEEQKLPPKYKDHALSGVYSGYRECHIQPDWLLIYKIKADVLVLLLTRTGTHSDLFR